MFDPSAWRAGVLHEDPVTRNVIFVLGVAEPDGRGHSVVTEIGTDSVGLTRVDEGARMPSLRIPTDAARALYDALAQHFGGTSNSKQLRADYDAERARVDKLTAAVLTIVTREA